MKYYFTFGQSHRHKVDGIVFDKDCVIEIEAPDSLSARARMFRIFGRKWAFQYMEEPCRLLYPRGIYKF